MSREKIRVGFISTMEGSRSEPRFMVHAFLIILLQDKVPRVSTKPSRTTHVLTIGASQRPKDHSIRVPFYPLFPSSPSVGVGLRSWGPDGPRVRLR